MIPPVITRTTPSDQWPELLTVEEASAILAIGKGTTYDLCRRGELPSVRLGRLLRIPRSGLVSLLQATSGAIGGPNGLATH